MAVGLLARPNASDASSPDRVTAAARPSTPAGLAGEAPPSAEASSATDPQARRAAVPGATTPEPEIAEPLEGSVLGHLNVLAGGASEWVPDTPLSGAAVELEFVLQGGSEQPPIRTVALTDEGGSVAIRAPAELAGQDFQLNARLLDHAQLDAVSVPFSGRACRTGSTDADAASQGYELSEDPSEILVVDTAGNAVAGASISYVGQEVRTDAAGRAALRFCPLLEGKPLIVLADGYEGKFFAWSADPKERQEVVLAAAQPFPVEVYNAAGHAIEGALVSSGQKLFRPTPTDARGRALLDVGAQESMQLKVTAPGYAPYRGPVERGQRIELAVGVGLSGLVHLADGTPAAGARATLLRFRGRQGTTQADSTGRFHFPTYRN